MENTFNLKKFLAEGKLLKEQTSPIELKTQNFINQNFKDFSQLEDSEVSQFELNQVPSDIVEYLKTVERFDYKGIIIYYVEEKNQIWVENGNADLSEGLKKNDGLEKDQQRGNDKETFLSTSKGKHAVQVISNLISKPYDAPDLRDTLNILDLTTKTFNFAAEAAGMGFTSNGIGRYVNDDNYSNPDVAVIWVKGTWYIV